MTLFERSSRTRWLVPVVAAVALVGGGTAIGAVTASADPSLPDRSAAQLLVDLQQAQVKDLSGTVVETADLGLPELPTIGDSGSSSLTSVISGTHTLRIWYSGPDKARVALLGSLGESDIVRNGADLWTWSSADNTATHRTLSGPAAGDADSPTGQAVPTDLPKTPQEAADYVLSKLDPTTKVTTDGTATVAGRPAYELVLAPKDSRSLVAQVRIAIDAEQRVPLRVRVLAAGQKDPAFEVGFSAVSFAKPDASRFTFNPPPGTKVTEQTGDTGDTDKPGTAPSAAPAKDEPTFVGTGWTTVAVITGSSAGASSSGQLQGVLEALPKVSGSWGSGRLLTGSLFSVVVADDGRIAVGAVKPQLLYDALTA